MKGKKHHYQCQSGNLHYRLIPSWPLHVVSYCQLLMAVVVCSDTMLLVSVMISIVWEITLYKDSMRGK